VHSSMYCYWYVVSGKQYVAVCVEEVFVHLLVTQLYNEKGLERHMTPSVHSHHIMRDALERAVAAFRQLSGSWTAWF
jgi:hypothetical protein